jgi:hypothetical protein
MYMCYQLVLHVLCACAAGCEGEREKIADKDALSSRAALAAGEDEPLKLSSVVFKFKFA